jgi:hypothetical protein
MPHLARCYGNKNNILPVIEIKQTFLLSRLQSSYHNTYIQAAV